MSLVLKSSLLTWIEIQLMSLVDSERTAWAKILENIIVIAPTTKLESVTDGEWRFTLCRCLALLVRGIQGAIAPQNDANFSDMLIRNRRSNNYLDIDRSCHAQVKPTTGSVDTAAGVDC